MNKREIVATLNRFRHGGSNDWIEHPNYVYTPSGDAHSISIQAAELMAKDYLEREATGQPDPELEAMQSVLATLRRFGPDARQRIIDVAVAKALEDEPEIPDEENRS